MANNKGRRIRSTPNVPSVRNILPEIVHVDGNLEEAGFLTLLSSIPMVAVNTKKFSFFKDDWLPATDTIDGAVGSGTQNITVDTPTAFIPNQVWQNKRTGESVYVLSISGSVLTVEREVGRNSTDSTGTAAAAMNDGDTLMRVGGSQGEVSAKQVFQSTTSTEVFNYTEKKRYDINMSDWQRKEEREAGGDDWTRQLDKTMRQARKDLNGWLYLGERNSTTINGQSHFFAGGLDFFISSNVLGVSNTLFEYQWDEWLSDEAMRHGESEKTLLASMQLIRALNQIMQDRLEVSRTNLGAGDMAGGINVVSYLAPTGRRLNIMEDRFLTESLPGHGRVVDMSLPRLRHFSNRGLDGRPMMKENTQDPDADNYEAYILMDIGAEWGPEEHHGKVSGVTGGQSGRSVT